MCRSTLVGLCACALLQITRPVSAWDPQPISTTIHPEDGVQLTVQGTYDPDKGVGKYLGVPYASPPVDRLRFARPQPPDYSSISLINATGYRPSCSQITPSVAGNFGKVEGDYGTSEDCLYLNVYVPHGINQTDPLPSYVFLHGGGYFGGAASIYDGSNLVQKSVEIGRPIIYISIEGREGVLGYPAGKEFGQAGLANVGLRDIKLALQWVQDNIGSFGGDKEKVTVSGQSQGASITGILYLDQGSTLFRSGIIMSGSASLSTLNTSGNLPDQGWNYFLNLTGCSAESSQSKISGDGDKDQDSVECLRELPTEMILKAQQNASDTFGPYAIFGPIVDGDIIPRSPFDLLDSGEFLRKPLIIGQTRDEGASFVPSSVGGPGAFEGWAAGAPPNTISNETLKTLIGLYPEDPGAGCPFDTGNDTFGLDPVFKRLSAFTTDTTFTAPRRHLLDSAIKAGLSNIWTYSFDQPAPSDSSVPKYYGAYHEIDLNYLFGGPNFAAFPFNVTDKELEAAEMTYWINFVNFMDPNGDTGSAGDNDSLTLWPKYDQVHKSLLSLKTGNMSVIPDTYRKEATDLFNSVPELIRSNNY